MEKKEKMKQTFKYVKYNMLRDIATNVRDNPFIDDATQDAYNAVYVLFQYCLHSQKCVPKDCPVAQLIGCSGKFDICMTPPQWGYCFVPNDREHDGGLHYKGGY